jgi:crotonobetainyl-CoA:carnitine CoA-transferase CaiB-like acyl-CoA transferase
MRETGLSLEIDHPLFGALVRAAPPVAFSEMSGRVAPICLRGEHNRTILGELGCSTAEISELERDGVVFPPDATAARAMR